LNSRFFIFDFPFVLSTGRPLLASNDRGKKIKSEDDESKGWAMGVCVFRKRVEESFGHAPAGGRI
jgi:hypothetical protein